MPFENKIDVKMKVETKSMKAASVNGLCEVSTMRR